MSTIITRIQRKEKRGMKRIKKILANAFYKYGKFSAKLPSIHGNHEPAVPNCLKN